MSEPTPPGGSAPAPRSAETWLTQVRRLVEAIRAYARWPLPDAGPVRTALAACRTAAEAVGDEDDRALHFGALLSVHLAAVDQAERVLACPPFESVQAWTAAGALGRPHDWVALRMEAEEVDRRLRAPAIAAEIRLAEVMTRLAATVPDPGPPPDRRVGSTMIVRGRELELTDQLARLLELALRPDGLTFEDARVHFETWAEHNDSEIRARVSDLKKRLHKRTRTAQFTIAVTTKSKRIKATVRPRQPTTEKLPAP
ncbi:MAG: hypothetical protein K2V38_14180 [Gemmataceae bacterium]|nr:hypothetical protein [Gemmataceae bacterium]